METEKESNKLFILSVPFSTCTLGQIKTLSHISLVGFVAFDYIDFFFSPTNASIELNPKSTNYDAASVVSEYGSYCIWQEMLK